MAPPIEQLIQQRSKQTQRSPLQRATTCVEEEADYGRRGMTDLGLSDYMFHHNRLSRTRLPLYPKESFMAADVPPFDPVTELGSFEYPVGGIGERSCNHVTTRFQVYK